MDKVEIAKAIGQLLKQMGFKAVAIGGVNYRGEYHKGTLDMDNVKINIEPRYSAEDRIANIIEAENFTGSKIRAIEHIKKNSEKISIKL